MCRSAQERGRNPERRAGTASAKALRQEGASVQEAQQEAGTE